MCPVQVLRYGNITQSCMQLSVYHHGWHNSQVIPELPNHNAIINAIKKYPRTSAVQILHNELADCLKKDDVTEKGLEKFTRTLEACIVSDIINRLHVKKTDLVVMALMQ